MPANAISIANFNDLGRRFSTQKEFLDIMNNCNRLKEIVESIQAKSGTTINKTTIRQTVNNTAAEWTQNSTAQVLTGVAAAGQAIAIGNAIYRDSNQRIYLASATDGGYPCVGIVTGFKPTAGGLLVQFVNHGPVVARLTGMSGDNSEMFLSATPGTLTNNPSEERAFLQYVGIFDSWTSGTAQTMGNVVFTYSPSFARS